MSFIEVANGYMNILYNQFNFDVMVFSQWWLYAPLLIPALCYAWFFAVKWVFLTLPIWAPIRLVFYGIFNVKNR